MPGFEPPIMNKLLPILCLFSFTIWIACKDKSAKTSDNQDIPGQITQPGSINPQSVAGRLEQATEAAENNSGLVWAGNFDPICSMKVDRDVEDTVHYQGKIYGFCSGSCKEKFQDDPQKGASKMPKE